MDLTNVIAITGMPGLYSVVGQSKGGVIVESLDTKKRMPAFSSNKVSSLEDISIFTYTEEVPLKDVFKKIFDKESGKAVAEPKDNNAFKTYFLEILPDFDQERVYTSDIKKVLKWYNALQTAGLLAVEDDKKAKKTEKSEEGKEGAAKPKATAKVKAVEKKPVPQKIQSGSSKSKAAVKKGGSTKAV